MEAFKPVKFGKYILLDKIATGGMAELYRAKITGAKGFEKLIAIKKILPHLTSENALVSSFIDEAKLAAFLQHPNIVQIYDFGSMEGTYFIAMEYLMGKDLKYIIDKAKESMAPVRLEDAIFITTQICKGLFYAHNLKDFHGKSLSLIHRDIGPQNIFITYDGQVKIIDFGIAKAANQITLTQSDLIKGKIAYMSPEQARGKDIDHRSDIFSIGIILYELITHRRMFIGDTYQIYSKVCEMNFEPPENLVKNLPPVLYDIINRALAENPEQRYGSAEEMGSDLESCLSQISDQTTSRNLMQYMKGLLGKEADAEERAMREMALFDFEAESDSEKAVAPDDEATRVMDIGEMTQRPGPKVGLVAALALILIVLSIAVTRFGNENPGGIVTKEDTAFLLPFSEQNGSENATIRTSLQKLGIWKFGSDIPELKEGKKLLEEKRFTEAILFFENLLVKDPSVKEKISAAYSFALRKQAAKLIEKNEPEKAKRLLLKSEGTNPADAIGHYMLGRIYADEKDYDRAVLSYKNAIGLDPNFSRAYFNLGYIYYVIKKDYVKAQEMYQHTVRISPDFLDDALYMLALSQKRLGKKQECIRNLEKSLDINPDNRQAQTTLARLKKM